MVRDVKPTTLFVDNLSISEFEDWKQSLPSGPDNPVIKAELSCSISG